MAAHMTWSVGVPGDLVTLVADSDIDVRPGWIRLRLDEEGESVEKDFTAKQARDLWWALGQACDLIESQGDD